jgi:nucleoside-diphosphate-sugar epimerase
VNSVAILGATSMLGKRLTAIFAQEGIAVTTCGRGENSDIVVDLTQGFKTNVPDNLRIHTLFNCAASFCDDSWEGCRKNDLVNAFGCYWAVELAIKLGCRHVVNAGSLSSVPGVEEHGMGSYGFSKARGEDILEWGLSRSGILFTSVRFPQLYDEYGDCCRHQPWFGRIVAYAGAGKDLNMPKSAGARNFVHVSDAARMLLAASRLGASGRMNGAHFESLTYEQIASLAYSVFKNGGKINEAREKAPFRKVNFPSGENAFTALKYRPEITMLQGLTMIKDHNMQGNFGPMDVE